MGIPDIIAKKQRTRRLFVCGARSVQVLALEVLLSSCIRITFAGRWLQRRLVFSPLSGKARFRS